MSKKIFSYLISRFLIPLLAVITFLSAYAILASTPFIWEPIYDYSMPEGGKLKPEWREDAKTISRAFWNNESYTDINEAFKKTSQRYTLHKKEIIHYEEVRDIIHFLFIPFTIGFFTLIIWRWAMKKPIRWRWSLGYVTLGGAALAIWGTLAWRNMFRTLHWWIFQDDSWILPKNCYSLKLYPYAVWQTVGAVVLGALFLSLMILAILEFIASRKERRKIQLLAEEIK